VHGNELGDSRCSAHGSLHAIPPTSAGPFRSGHGSPDKRRWHPEPDASKTHDLRNVAAAVNVKAAVAVTIFALNILLLVEGVLEVLGGIRMTAHTGIAPNSACAWNFNVGSISICRSGFIAGGQM